MRILIFYDFPPTETFRGDTPLIFAIVNNSSEVIMKLLLDNGADPTITSEGRSPLIVAELRRDKRKIKVLREALVKKDGREK